MAAYRFKPGRGYPVDAQTVGQHLDRLQHALGGRLTPKDVVSDARRVDAPLHPIFEWDNAKAGQLHREQQARQLITSVRIVREAEGDAPAQLVRAYVNLRDNPDEEEASAQAYRPLSVVLADVSMRAQLLAQARAEMVRFMAKYDEIQELVALAGSIVEHIDRLRGASGPTEAHP